MPVDFSQIAEPIEASPVVDFSSIAEPVAEATPDFSSIAEETKPEETDSRIGEDEIVALATKRGANAQDLIDAAGFYGGVIKGKELDTTEILKDVAGKVSEAVPLIGGLPLWLYKKSHDEPTRLAIDDLKDLIASRKSGVQTAIEIGSTIAGQVGLGGVVAKAVPMVGNIIAGGERAAKAANLSSSLEKAGKFTTLAGNLGKSATLAKAAIAIPTIALPSATGMLYGSKEGEEIKDAMIGLTVGAGLGLGAVGAGKVIRKLTSSALDKEVMNKAVKQVTGGVAESNSKIDEFLKQMPKEDGIKVIQKADAIMEADAPKYAVQKKNVLSQELSMEDEEHLLTKIRGRAEELGIDPEDTNALRSQLDEELDIARKTDITDFTRYLGRKEGKAADYLAEQIRVEGPQFIEEQLGRWQRVQAVKQGLEDTFIKKVESPSAAIFTTIADGLRSRRKGLRDLDRRLGTNTELLMDKISESISGLSNTKMRLYGEARELAKERAALNIDDSKINAFIESKIPVTAMTEQELAHVEKVKAFSDKLLTEANEAGVGIERKEGYVTHAVADAPEVMRRLDMAYSKLEKELGFNLGSGDLPQDALARLKESQLGKQVLDSLEDMNGNVKIERVGDLAEIAANYVDPKFLGSRKFSSASYAKRRDGNIPPLLREQNIEQLQQKWIANTFHHAYLREPLAGIKEVEKIAQAVGDERSQKYLARYADSILNPAGAEGTLALAIKQKLGEFSLEMHRNALKSSSPVTQQAYKLLAEFPEVFSILTSQVYPNFLGANVRATLTNLMQPIMNTLPELGVDNAHHVMGGYLRAAKQLIAGEDIILKNKELALSLGKQIGDIVHVKNPSIILRNEGLKPAQWNTELAGTIHQAMNKHPLTKALGGLTDKWSSIVMYAYEAAETSNRIVARNIADSMSEQLTKEFASGQAGSVMRFLKTVGPAYRREIVAAQKAGDSEKSRELLGKYIMGKTIFNYDKASVGEFAAFMGPLLSAFTRWPIEIASNAAENFTQRGYIKGGAITGMQYLAPFAALSLINDTLLTERDQPGVQRLLFGKQGITSMSPAGSLKTFTDPFLGTGAGILASPLVGTIGGVTAGFSQLLGQGDDAKLMKALTNTAKSYTPVLGTIGRILTNDTGVIE